MKRKLKIMNHQIDQLKEEISAKEGALVKEHLENLRVEKEKEGLKVINITSPISLYSTHNCISNSNC